MGKTIVILGTLDTKGPQLGLLKQRIAARGHEALLLDLSLGAMDSPGADVTARELAALGGRGDEAFVDSRDRFTKAEVMLAGAQEKLRHLLAADKLDGAVALGGASMALTGSRLMAGLPFGIPKVVATPAAMPAYLSEWFGAADILVMQVILEFTGRNGLLDNVIGQVAGVVSGMVEESLPRGAVRVPSPSVATTEIGFCPACAHEVEKELKARGYHAFPFHAQGISERAMDRLISEGYFDALIDIVPAGVIEELFEGNRAGGKERLDAVCERGIPLVLAPCTVNLTGCGPTRKHRERYESRGRVYKMDALRSMTRYDGDELRQAARVYAEKLNRARAPVKFVVPLKGWSAIDRPGTVLHDPEADRVFVDALRKDLGPQTEIIELDHNLEDPEFARALVEIFDRSYRQAT